MVHGCGSLASLLPFGLVHWRAFRAVKIPRRYLFPASSHNQKPWEPSKSLSDRAICFFSATATRTATPNTAIDPFSPARTHRTRLSSPSRSVFSGRSGRVAGLGRGSARQVLEEMPRKFGFRPNAAARDAEGRMGGRIGTAQTQQCVRRTRGCWDEVSSEGC